MLKIIAVLVILISLTACTTVTHTPLSTEASVQLRKKSFASTQYPPADFAAFTAGKAAFGLIGAAVMVSEGNTIVKDNGIEDPARKISRGLIDRLVVSREMQLTKINTTNATNDDIGALISRYPGPDYLLDVKTFNWMFNYYPTDWAHYKVSYSARLRLIDTSNKKVIAETMCSSVQGDDKNPPSKDQLLENKAALLKKYLDQAADICVNLLAYGILKLPVLDKNEGTLNLHDAAQPVVPKGNIQSTITHSDEIVPNISRSSNLRETSSPDRQLIGEELKSHFINLGSVLGNIPNGSTVRLNVDTDGSFDIRNLTSIGKGHAYGTYKINTEDNQICFVVSRVDWKIMQDCYRLFEVGTNKFAMRSVTDNYFISYALN